MNDRYRVLEPLNAILRIEGTLALILFVLNNEEYVFDLGRCFVRLSCALEFHLNRPKAFTYQFVVLYIAFN